MFAKEQDGSRNRCTSSLVRIAKQARPDRDFQNASSLLLLRDDTTRLCQTMAEERIQALRVELKTWEKQFSVQHGGKRPSREDIKNNVEIGIKARDLESMIDY